MKNNFPLKILQITDTHLFKNNNHEMFGVKTNLQLKKLIDHLFLLNISIDRIFLTGDVSQDMSPESYQYAMQQLERFKRPVYWIPGNHDDFYTMQEQLNKTTYFQSSSYLKLPQHSFIFLNTKYKNVDSGYFHNTDKELIEEIMQRASKDENFCIVMHHHPVKTNTPLIDNYILKNTGIFWDVIDHYPNIKNIICGHVHGDYTMHHKNITVHAALASCLQFKKGSIEKDIEKSIGCKLYEFNTKLISATTIMVDESTCLNG